MFTLPELLDTEDVAAALKGMGVDDPAEATLEAIGYPSGSPATAALYRVHGDGWSLFCKVLQHVKHWPGLAFMPPEVGAEFAEQFPWRSELELWDPPVVAALPTGLRVPVLHRLVELPDDRVAVWMEDVPAVPTCWELDRFVRAAYLLGRWNARSSTPELLAASTLPPGFALRMYAERAVLGRGLEPLADDDLWAHPWLREHGRLREDLRVLGTRIPEMLARLDTYVQCMPHGDASPQNLLVPADDPDTFVVIDISFRSPHALGFDLGQLLVGLTHAGQIPAATMPSIAAAIGPAYLRGLHEEGITDQDAAVRDAFATSVLLRSGFDGFLYDLIDDPTEDNERAFADRVVMAGALVELYRSR
jgi:hypothetical protein